MLRNLLIEDKVEQTEIRTERYSMSGCTDMLSFGSTQPLPMPIPLKFIFRLFFSIACNKNIKYWF